MAEIQPEETYTLILTREETVALHENLGNQAFDKLGGYGSPLHELFKLLDRTLRR